MLELMSAKPMDGHHGSRTQVKIPKPSLLSLKYCPWPYFKKKSGKVRKKKLKKVLDPFLSGTTKHMIFALFFPFFAYPFLKLYDFLPRLIAAAIHLKSEDVSTNPAHLLAGSKRPLNAFFFHPLQRHRSLALRASHMAGILTTLGLQLLLPCGLALERSTWTR